MAGQVPTKKAAVKVITGHLVQVIEELTFGEVVMDEDTDALETGLGLVIKGSGKLTEAEKQRLEDACELVSARLGKIGGE